MADYAILIFPAANRVYTASSAALLGAELGVFSAKLLSTPVREVGERELGGVTYVTFSTRDPLTAADVTYLSNLSSLYALFEMDNQLLRPLELCPTALCDSDLLTIQRYSGKTNELFTKLLLNVTLLSTQDPAGLLREGAHVLDPLCGRGTTLHQAMMYGFDATGVEADSKDFDAYCQFIKTWLRNKRIKHSAETIAIRKHKQQLGKRIDIEYGRSKQHYKSGDTRRLAYLNCDTLRIDELLQANSADVIVTDAPYGVQHGSRRPAANLTRDPRELLTAALPGWLRALRPGGAIGLSWNVNVAERVELVRILTDAGLDVASEGPFERFAHRVDQAIVRDLVVARNP